MFLIGSRSNIVLFFKKVRFVKKLSYKNQRTNTNIVKFFLTVKNF